MIEKRKSEPWWTSKWAKRLALLCVGAALGASCSMLPEIFRPACVAVVNVLHAAGVP